MINPGFIGISTANGQRLDEVCDLIATRAEHGTSVLRSGSVAAICWGFEPGETGGLLLVGSARWRDRFLSPRDLPDLLSPPRCGDLVDALPPFAAAVLRDGELRVATDAIGYRHVYMMDTNDLTAVSTSLSALATIAPRSLDTEALAVQSLLGWQLGDRTIYAGIRKLRAGHVVSLSDARATVTPYAHLSVPEPRAVGDVLAETATFLRRSLDAYLEQEPTATLQLSGGQDSRILLSAVAPGRRRGLSAMTLLVPDSEDTQIAAELARREGLDHRVSDLAGLEELSAAEAHRLALAASIRIGHMANPLATAALLHAESVLPAGPRIAGLGGEVARGFYYTGSLVPWPITRASAGMLATWRLFPNDAVSDEPLVSDFAAWRRSFTISEVLATLKAPAVPYWQATDEFYLYQRMQRWAGVLDSASCFERETVNPMLDHRFISAVRALRPEDKRGSRFLGQLQVALDGELAAIPLDGRPPPVVYARGGFRRTWTGLTSTTSRVLDKVGQRLRSAPRPPAGAELLAKKVVEHWRNDPDAISSLERCPIVDSAWLTALVQGRHDAPPSTIAFLVNVTAALESADGWA